MAKLIVFIFSDNIDVEKLVEQQITNKMRYTADFIITGIIEKNTEVVAHAIENILDEGRYRKNRAGNLDIFNNKF